MAMATMKMVTHPIHDNATMEQSPPHTIGACGLCPCKDAPTSPPRVVSRGGDGERDEGPLATTEARAWPPICITGRFSRIDDYYCLDPARVLGTGRHGGVCEGVDRTTGARRAVKSISKRDPTAEPAGIAREIALLWEADHDGVVRLVDVFEDAESVHIVTELCRGGELFDRIVARSAEKAAGCFDEVEAADIVRRMVETVAYLHSIDVVHRDVKPENVLFATPEAGAPTKLIDFGLSRKHRPGDAPMTTLVGTPYYMAPEVLRRRYDRACDLWSLGVLTYVLLCGYPPFNGRTTEETQRSVLRGRYCFPWDDWENVSDEAIDFVRGLLRRDPRDRTTAAEALRHPWLQSQGRDADGRMDKVPSAEAPRERMTAVEALRHPWLCSRGRDAGIGMDEVPVAEAPGAEAPAIHEAKTASPKEEQQDRSSVEVVYRTSSPSKPLTSTVALAGGFKRGLSPPRSPERKVRMSMFTF